MATPKRPFASATDLVAIEIGIGLGLSFRFVALPFLLALLVIVVVHFCRPVPRYLLAASVLFGLTCASPVDVSKYDWPGPPRLVRTALGLMMLSGPDDPETFPLRCTYPFANPPTWMLVW